MRPMDPLTARAIDDYHRLLRDDVALRQEIEERFLDRVRDARLTFGGRVLCPFPRPNLVSPAVYEQIRGVCRGHLRRHREGGGAPRRGPLGPRRRHPRGARAGPHRSRVRPQLADLAAGLVRHHQRLPVRRAERGEPGGDRLRRGARRSLPGAADRAAVPGAVSAEALPLPRGACWRRSSPATARRAARRRSRLIAIVDYEDVPTRTEHHLFRDFFESRGYPALVCDPRHLTYEGGRLRHDGREIDIVYKRLLVNEFLERIDELQPLLQAAKDRAVTLVNPFRCKPIHKKAIFAVLTDDELQPLFTAEERAAIAAHVPWTRRVRRGADHARRTRDRSRPPHPRPPRRPRPEAERRVRRQGRAHRMGDDGVGVGRRPGRGAGVVLRRAGEGRPAARDVPGDRPRRAAVSATSWSTSTPSSSTARWRGSSPACPALPWPT